VNCSECDSKATAKGFCKKHYYANKRKSTDPKDIAIYRTNHSQRAMVRYLAMTPKRRGEVMARAKERMSRKREELYHVLTPACALSKLSPCSTETTNLRQDHDHSCSCGKRTGCSKCFRGLLCTMHNRLMLPVVEKFYPEHIPSLVSEYLKQRPLLGTGVEPF